MGEGSGLAKLVIDADLQSEESELTMSGLINIFIALGCLGAVIAVVALWTQRDINRAREKDAEANKANDKMNA